ncbi:MAG TPA: NAD(P)/FAD-dependent oxidoreductase, partial [Burkholderiales bacterium]|nr:NAD(P)/FAD-dependent oxidoreductase [Burkholderiales bacterium]
GEQVSPRIVISAAGFLTQPSIPEIEGLDRFAGPVFHSARWDPAARLAAKRVAVIGTGASAIQIVPSIAPEVARLLVFQRTPPWITPKADRALSERERRLLRRFPFLQRLMRLWFYLQHEVRAIGFTRYPNILRRREKEVLAYLEHSVRDPDLRTKLRPSYTLGCKRVLPSNDFYPAIQRDNVELVTGGIERVESDAIVTRDGARHAVDAIVLATGFTAAEAGAPFRTIGLDGADLDAHWRNGPHAYLGTSVAGFPNLFLLLGPNTGLGHNSMIYMIESQVHYVMRALAGMRRRGVDAVTVREDAQSAYNREIQSRLSRTVWTTGGCKSWYQRRDGRITTLWPGYTFEFRRRLRRVRWSDYQAIA